MAITPDLFTEAEVYYLTAPRQLTLKKEELTSVKEDQILARTLRTVISPGTETAAYLGLPPLRPGSVYPRVVGYCNVARIVSIGSNVKNYVAGDLVLTFQSHRSAFICDQKDIILKVPDSVNLNHAACTYLYHLGYSALLSGECTPGFNVAVIGMGTLGFTCAQMAVVAGCRVFVVTQQHHVADILNRKGITILDKRGWTSAQVEDMTARVGIDLVVNTSNTWEDWLGALKLARKGGTIVNLGFPGRGQPLPDFNPLDSQYVYDKQLTIRACGHVSDKDSEPSENRFNLKRNMEFLFHLVKESSLSVAELLSFECRYTELDRAYDMITNRQNKLLFTGVLKWD